MSYLAMLDAKVSIDLRYCLVDRVEQRYSSVSYLFTNVWQGLVSG